MNVHFEDKEGLNATLRVEIAKDDYIRDYNKSLNDVRAKSAIKGFRKGKAPMGYIRKIYGQSALADAVNDALQHAVQEHLSARELRYFGQPIPSEDHQPVEFDPANPADYTFSFDLGLLPEVDLKGTDAKIQRYDVQVSPDTVDEEWQSFLKRMGQRVDVEDSIESEDVLYLRAREMDENGIKDDGVESSFALLVEDIADNKLKERVLKMKAGDTFDFAPANLEKDRDIEFVKKYHLGLEDDMDRELSDKFEAEIERVQRVQLPELNQELFDQMFGEDKVHSEDEAKEEIKSYLKESFDRQADAVLYRQMQDSLMHDNEITLPETFLDRWMEYARKEDEPEPTDHDKIHFKLDLKWQLVKDEIARRNNLEVTREDLEAGAYRRVLQYVGHNADRDGIRRLVEVVLGNEQQVDQIAREALANKVFDVLKESFQIKDKAIAEDKFREESQKILNAHNH